MNPSARMKRLTLQEHRPPSIPCSKCGTTFYHDSTPETRCWVCRYDKEEPVYFVKKTIYKLTTTSVLSLQPVKNGMVELRNGEELIETLAPDEQVGLLHALADLHKYTVAKRPSS